MVDALINLIDAILGNPVVLSILAGAAVTYVASCVVKPYKICKACNRSKESHSKLYKGAFGPCRACKGAGHHVRVGARILGRKL
ncbi:hypothetical protein [Nonomuraea sp. NPDC049400]|uniref:hypothetical protein n=1 Tax=Nonomuraea sp. NPDC049400 TaxID=3364352 RepID=UPI00379362FF